MCVCVCVCVIFYYKPLHEACRCLEATAAFQNDHILSQIEVIDFSRAPLGNKQPVPSSPEEEKGDYIIGGPGPPSSLSSPQSAPSTSSGGVLLALMHPTLVLPKKTSTASVDFSFHNQLPEGALGCFHPWAFPMSFHGLLIWGIQALHSVNRWWRVCLFPPSHY